ncbi:MAG: hypothetical protein L3K00_05095 [Thermoplasmata archaeon]|nr:hypothetical protein [Thermoplasmata archaeon]MCI4362179.1 hypothetical protein [Thermoplasmata archaeon]
MPIALVAVPVSHSMGFATPPVADCLGSRSVDVPQSPEVTGTWTRAGAVLEPAVILDPSGHAVYDRARSSGSFSFPGDGGRYAFEVRPGADVASCSLVEPTTFTVVWLAPIL